LVDDLRSNEISWSREFLRDVAAAAGEISIKISPLRIRKTLRRRAALQLWSS
jgi:hypothetical protein